MSLLNQKSSPLVCLEFRGVPQSAHIEHSYLTHINERGRVDGNDIYEYLIRFVAEVLSSSGMWMRWLACAPLKSKTHHVKSRIEQQQKFENSNSNPIRFNNLLRNQETPIVGKLSALLEFPRNL